MDFPSFNLNEFEQETGFKRKKLSASLDFLCQNLGFLLITDHQIPKEVISNQWKVVSKFFSQRSEVKSKVKVPYPGYPYGWIPSGRESLGHSLDKKLLPDLKESFNGGPLNIPKNVSDPDAYKFCYQLTPWPDLDGFKEAWQDYYFAMESLSKRLMKVFAEALGLKREYFNPFIQNPISALRAIYYPSTKENYEPKQQRAGAHTDYGSLTILLPQPETSGLQVFHNKEWIDVPNRENSFIVNIGDLMALWTSGRWRSTLHRVIASPNQPSRKSLAFFHQPDWDAVISPIFNSSGYESVQSGPYLMERFKEANS